MILFSSEASGAATNDAAYAENKTVLVGDVVTMNEGREVIRDGRLCLHGKLIVAVLRMGDELPAGFEDAAVVETNGTIYPGLFDLHNHLPYNFIPLWQVDRLFANRLEWQRIAEYYPAVRAPFKLLNEHRDVDYRRAIVRFTECRNLLGGVTTGHGMGFTKEVHYGGLMRNIEEPLVPELPAVQSKTPDLNAEGIDKMIAWTAQGKPFIYHLGEGVDQHARERFLDLQNAPGALNRHLVCIHSVGLQREDFPAMAATAGIVWSPTSNLLLYGQTCRVDEAKKHGVPIAIGADWSPSGCKNLLGELKVVRAVSNHLGRLFSDEELVAAVTCTPARMIGWDKKLGSIEAGNWADLLILAGSGGDHYARLVEAQETSIRAVMIDGRVRIGEADGLVIGDPLSSEAVTIGGKEYLLDLAESGTDGVGGMPLSTALEKIRYGLEHLPELEKAHGQPFGLEEAEAPATWRFEDEMHSDSSNELWRDGETLPARAMRLAPLAGVDDPRFRQQMLESVNMPDYAKKAFSA